MKFPSIRRDVGAWFGMFLASWSDAVMLVEGELDAMRLMTLGYFNVVASATSQVTDRQIDALVTDRLVLGYDSDLAGEHACRRVVDRVGRKATVLKADWSLAVKDDGKRCNDAGDLPDGEQLNLVLSNLRKV